jgi:hypothetical protein
VAPRLGHVVSSALALGGPRWAGVAEEVLVRFPAVVVAALLVLAGCTSAQFNRNVSAPRYPPYAGEVAVLQSPPSAGTFERLGVVVVTAGDAGTMGGMLADLKKAAAKQGANAVMLQHDKLREGTSAGGTEHKLAAWAFRVRQ